MAKRDSFVFYRSFMEVVEMLPKQSQPQMIAAIIDMGLNDNIEDSLPLEMRMALVQMRASVRGSKSKHDIAVQNGKLGGAPKGSHNNPFGRKGKKELTKTNLNVNENVNSNENSNVNENSNENVNNNLCVSSGKPLEGAALETEEKEFDLYGDDFDDEE